jgi:hypothetical protein
METGVIIVSIATLQIILPLTLPDSTGHHVYSGQSFGVAGAAGDIIQHVTGEMESAAEDDGFYFLPALGLFRFVCGKKQWRNDMLL